MDVRVRKWSATLLGLTLLVATAARGQAPTTAKVEALPLELKSPDRYQIHSALEPIRRVSVTAPVDGILRSLDLPVGSTVRELQEIGQLDRAEASARLKIAQAQVKEAQANVEVQKQSANAAIAKAQLEAAQARAELADLDLDRCTLRAPFAGRLLEVSVSPGQFLPKGTKVAELADVSSLRVLVPFDRGKVTLGGNVDLDVEGRKVTGKVQATLPLPESLAPLRELATVFTAAWVVVPNPKGELEPGQRVLGPSLPTAPIATIPARALREPDKGEPGGPGVQVIRNEYVTDVPVRILGHPGPERVQVSGLLRATDALIATSSVPLVAGTLIRFSGAASGGAIEGFSPNPAEGGEIAGITPPRASTKGTNILAKPRTTSTRPASPPKAASPTPPPTTKGATAVPF